MDHSTLAEHIKRAAPNLNAMEVQNLVSGLRDSIGVDTKEDMNLVEEKDLLPFAKIIAIRKILKYFVALPNNEELHTEKRNQNLPAEAISLTMDTFQVHSTNALQDERIVYNNYTTPVKDYQVSSTNVIQAKESLFKSYASPVIDCQITSTNAIQAEKRSLKNYAIPVKDFHVPSTSGIQDETSLFENYPIPVKDFCLITRSKLRKGLGITPAERRAVVRVIVNDLMKICLRPTKPQVVHVAKKCAQEFPSAFLDLINGKVLGCGYSSILSQLICRIENVTRGLDPHFKRKRKVAMNSGSTTQEKEVIIVPSDIYGCVDFNPPILETQIADQVTIKDMLKDSFARGVPATDEEIILSLQTSYPLQRRDILSRLPLSILKESWPYLFVETGLVAHASELTGVAMKDKLEEILDSRSEDLRDFITVHDNKQCNVHVSKVCSEIKSACLACENQLPKVPGTFFMLMAHFKEDQNLLFPSLPSNSGDAENSEKMPPHPCLISYGDPYTTSVFAVSIHQEVLIMPVSSFSAGVTIMLAVYIAFNIEYPKEAALTLEFIQRFFMDINPASPIKKPGIPRKVLFLIRKMEQENEVGELPLQPVDSQSEISGLDDMSGNMKMIKLQIPQLVAGSVCSVLPQEETLKDYRIQLKPAALEKPTEEQGDKIRRERENTFKDLTELQARISLLNCSDFWNVLENIDCVIIFHLVVNPAPKVLFSVVIKADLNTSAFIEDIVIKEIGNYTFPMVMNNVDMVNEVLDLLKYHARTVDESVRITQDVPLKVVVGYP